MMSVGDPPTKCYLYLFLASKQPASSQYRRSLRPSWVKFIIFATENLMNFGQEGSWRDPP